MSLPVLHDEGLPGIDRPLDNTAMSAYMACPRDYYLGMVLHRRAGGKSASLAFGGLVHYILENHYKTGGAVALVEGLAEGWWKEHGVEAPGDYRTFQRAILDYKRFREKYGQRPEDEPAKTVGYPEEPMVEIAADIRAGGLIHPYAVKIDRIIEDGGLHYVEDHKTTSRLDKNFFDSFDLSNQMRGYVRVAQLLMPSLRIVGVRVNVWHCIKTATNFVRETFTYTREELLEWEQNTNEWARRISRDAQAWPSEAQLHEGAAWPLAHLGDNGCSRKYGLCQYHKLCRLAAPFRHRALEDYPVAPWNPLDIED